MANQLSAKSERNIISILVLAKNICTDFSHRSRIRPPMSADKVESGSLQLLVNDFNTFILISKQRFNDRFGS